MLPADEAVRELKKQGLDVQVMMGPQGPRYHISSAEDDRQISHAELMGLLHRKQLNWDGVKGLFTDEA